ncbi:hypothetical protein LRX75_00010 [Rhizobium sp. DKSPLA3]|uniref:Uncharacterized protein n=1 Tax=Rhizobium quercicola TaxID=2901226 RepID=A0A9X1NN99_9HYPH|nr:hypothetical protein [Rhizobium quercicola]MCD7107408.1 hypothetical protein [Rhizobium quercicola]
MSASDDLSGVVAALPGLKPDSAEKLAAGVISGLRGVVYDHMADQRSWAAVRQHLAVVFDNSAT